MKKKNEKKSASTPTKTTKVNIQVTTSIVCVEIMNLEKLDHTNTVKAQISKKANAICTQYCAKKLEISLETLLHACAYKSLIECEICEV